MLNNGNRKYFQTVNVKIFFFKYVSFRRTRGAKIDSNTISEHQQTTLFFYR